MRIANHSAEPAASERPCTLSRAARSDWRKVFLRGRSRRRRLGLLRRRGPLYAQWTAEGPRPDSGILPRPDQGIRTTRHHVRAAAAVDRRRLRVRAVVRRDNRQRIRDGDRHARRTRRQDRRAIVCRPDQAEAIAPDVPTGRFNSRASAGH
jgi:hypothetical protein